MPPPPAGDLAFSDQIAQLEKQATALADAAQSLSADQVTALSDQAAQLAFQFDVSSLGVSGPGDDSLEDAIGKATTVGDKFLTDSAMSDKLAQITAQFDSPKFAEMEAAAAKMAAKFDMAFLQNPNPGPSPAPPSPPRAPKPPVMFRGRGDSAYNAGTRDLDEHKYEDAVQRFDSAILQEPTRAEGALYWKAYALNRLGKRDQALAALDQLRREHASSSWLKDAQVLEAEVRQGSGQPVTAAQESNDELRLLAINSLMNADAERAIPLVDGILKGSGTPAVKERALFVLSQNKSPRAQQVLTDYAKGSGNPDLQLRAIQYIGMSGTKDAQQMLVSIYSSSGDTQVKSSIIQSLMVARANDALLNIAKTEKDPALRNSAIRNVAMNKGTPVDSLVEIYGSADVSTKREIINGLAARGDAKALIDMARKESDPAMKRTIVERLGSMHENKDAMDYMMELLK